MESLRRFQAQVSKAGTSVVETRDTTHPALVTHLLIPMVEAIGGSATDHIPRIYKRIRDDTNLHHAQIPWRRLPFWLGLRVFTRKQLQSSLGEAAGRFCYKLLISVLLKEFMTECCGQLAPEMVVTLQAKICRRFAKLEQECQQTLLPLSEDMYAKVETSIQEAVKKTTQNIKTAWEDYRQSTKRSIPLLPLRADGDSKKLGLPNSAPYINRILSLPRSNPRARRAPGLPDFANSSIEQGGRFVDTYFELAGLEAKIFSQQWPILDTSVDAETSCIHLAQAIFDMFDKVANNYDSDPGQMSAFILALFTLWIRLDRCAITICPLLAGMHPEFTPELLDALHLSKLADMQRLYDIQQYLHDRCVGRNYSSRILNEPDKHAFVVQFVKRTPYMQTFLDQVQSASKRASDDKKIELNNFENQYDEHSKGISDGKCCCKISRDGQRDVRGCKKCWHWRSRNRMEIQAHEDYLPRRTNHAAAVVFELNAPPWYSAYRNATWQIVRLAHPTQPESRKQVNLLKDDESLEVYNRNDSKGITLASSPKAFKATHFRVSKKRMKASQKDVLLPNAMHYQYYDADNNVWLHDFDKPLTFQHICGVHVDSALGESVLRAQLHPPAARIGPTSYEIVASEVKCPSTLSLHEFTAYQRLLAASHGLWPTILMELVASNVNFSTESTMNLFNNLSLQAGPALPGSGIYRNIHSIFKDVAFCKRLLEQIRNRLQSITSNWREFNCMEVLITLLLRLCTLGPEVVHQSAQTVVEEARMIALGWIVSLRYDLRNTKDSSIASNAAKYAFTASLLCRRTFSACEEQELSSEQLCVFLQASLGLQENLIVDLTKLPPYLKSMLIRDVKMVHGLQRLLLRSCEANPTAIGQAVDASWSDARTPSDRVYSQWRVVPGSQNRWFEATMKNPSRHSTTQIVHFNIIEGHLLVDGQPRGTLPRNIRDSHIVKQLFGSQHLLTHASSEYGMTHVMIGRILGNQVHFGMRDGQVIIRARTWTSTYEYLPQASFDGNRGLDLPETLLRNCTHWLNLDTKQIEIRRNPVLWKTRCNDWVVDFQTRVGYRGNTQLIDPNSKLFQDVTSIFHNFEDARNITVVQPKNHNLSVELRFLELNFRVTARGLLECQELGEEIDPDQDIGTLYGLKSKIVLRDTKNWHRRSIITPMGAVTAERCGMHVFVRAARSDSTLR